MKWKVSNLEVTYKKVIMEDRPVNGSKDIYRIFLSKWDHRLMDIREDFCLLTFDTKLAQIGFVRLFSGGINGLQIDKKLVYGICASSGCDAAAVAHNHPSGDIMPSANDYHMTRNLYDGLTTLGIRFLDHLIVTRGGYFSFRDEGYI